MKPFSLKRGMFWSMMYHSFFFWSTNIFIPINIKTAKFLPFEFGSLIGFCRGLSRYFQPCEVSHSAITFFSTVVTSYRVTYRIHNYVAIAKLEILKKFIYSILNEWIRGFFFNVLLFMFMIVLEKVPFR